MDHFSSLASADDSPARKAIYHLLKAGETLQARDAYYCPATDQWTMLKHSDQPQLIGTAYDPGSLGPVRRFNK